MNEPLRIGLVGAGRSRNGLGPFLASACEKAGARVVAVAGRDAERAAHHAEELAQRLKHPVEARADLQALCAGGIDALVIASPQEAHLAALRAAASNGLSCLCEKPLVDPRDAALGLAVVQQFRGQGLVLHENAQWPFVLPVLAQLFSRPEGSPRLLEMGLSPMGGGALSMVADSLPHLLSLCLAVLP
ncbi:MAG: Gfo/Idh/MocA family oxidoreductase, partial [Planctomycetota bacterium]